MKNSRSWTLAVATAALLALPGTVASQTPPPATQPPATAQPAPQTTAEPAQKSSAQEHLRLAKATLNDVGTANLSARSRVQVAELKKRLTTLERSISANDSAGAAGTANRSASATRDTRGSVNWGTEVAAMDKTLTALLGPGTPTTGTPGATATTGNKAAATVTLDDVTRAKLTEFRTHLTAFAAAMAGQPAAGENAPGATPPGAPPSTTTDPAQAPASPSAAAAPVVPSPKADQEGARRHLTEARNTLSQLTQLPAAAQLSGEARTQVSQLISNFNELITTQTEWRAVYGKVAANFTSLLGPETGATDPASVSGTAGAVGTSGSGMNIDPAVRAKLVEMRKLLSEFERAAGGAAASANSSASAAGPAPSPKAATAPPTATSATAPTTGTTATGQSASSDPLFHIAAIEALFKSQNDSGGATLDKSQLELVRTHIAELRKLLEQARK